MLATYTNGKEIVLCDEQVVKNTFKVLWVGKKLVSFKCK
jgi:hypothetical protein